MPHLGVITDEISEDFEHALNVCAELNIRHLELRSIWNRSVVDHNSTDLQKILKLVQDGGFTVDSIASPFLKTHLDESSAPPVGNTHSAGDAPRSKQGEVLTRTLQVAELFNAPFVRTFSFWRIADPDSVREDILGELLKATETVEAAGRTLVLENEHACNIATALETDWYLQRIPSPAFGVIWDPGNEAASGSNPVPDGYNLIKSRIHHIHLKDPVSIAEGTKFTCIGDGAIDYLTQFQLLKQDGYTGTLSIETHYNKDDAREPATRECVDGVRRLAAEAGLELQ